DEIALAARELLVGHLALGVAELLVDHLLRGLRADASLEVVGDLDLLLGGDVPLLVEVLDPHAEVAGLGIHGRAHAEALLVELRMLLLPPRLVGRGHRLGEPVEDHLEGDPLVALQPLERRDHVGVHFLLPLPAGQSHTVRAAETSSSRSRRSPCSVSMTTSWSSTETIDPVWVREPSTGAEVLSRTSSPTRRSSSFGTLSGLSTPGELTSSAYEP